MVSLNPPPLYPVITFVWIPVLADILQYGVWVHIAHFLYENSLIRLKFSNPILFNPPFTYLTLGKKKGRLGLIEVTISNYGGSVCKFHP